MSDITPFLPDWLNKDETPIPSDIVGSKIVALGSVKRDGGDLALSIIYEAGAGTVKRVEFWFTELGMWIEDDPAIDFPSQITPNQAGS